MSTANAQPPAETPAAAAPETETNPENESSLRELARLYTLDETKAAPAETPDATKAPAKGKPKTLPELAERLQLKVEDLYELVIPSDTLKDLTLGKLKDHMADRENFATRSLRLEEDAARKEAEFSRANLELQTLLSALPADAIKPEVREAVRQKHEAALKVERARTLEAIPEWKNESQRTEELAAMVEYMQGFGYPAGYLATVNDHRALRFIRSSWQREQRLRKALELVTEQKPGALGKSNGQGAAPSQKPAQGQRLSRSDREIQRYLNVLNK